MKAIVLESRENPVVYKDVPKPTLQPVEVLVQIKAAALNRRDYWISTGKYAGLKYPTTLGADGSGIVTEVGSDADQDWIGKEVIINPSHNWGDSPDFQGNDFKILGLPEDGTFAEYVKTETQYLHTKPAHLNWEQAAALPLAGLTAFRALFVKGKAKKGDKVLIVGVGSGTGTFVLQYAVAAGCQVFVTSGTGEKIEQARLLGASAGVNYKAQDWAEQLRQLAGGFDVVIDSVLGESFSKIPALCNPGARIVTFGATMGDIHALNGRMIFWKQLQLLGTTMGTIDDFNAMSDFVDEHQIIPVVDEVFPLTDAKQAFDKMGSSSQFGKLVLRV
ncbi:zinc-binding dehydrogenase [Mucilaginibacter myungsuensis]|uniref:Zinc-binding dehydrogenase n=1 Tax=Mucilaginibacter myungsuensis TaxID=649104 RepID=A0A929KZ23_9SPHI|nr:zinc-binding dehydrogenase [Mucilaginibacter myungsuensis]MBE9661499.1 zinc-binding dehydrogenase [Mucilaginibacter myungsuensis]MDN3597642.1 zinc-binding dehydrogenase [Mucilaginibacter myungsuensis]